MRPWRTILAVLGLGLSACEQPDPLAPPQIVFGEDVCDVCRMIVSDERYAAAAITTDPAGEHAALRFDDIGCLLRLESQGSGPTIAAAYVRDFVTGAWLPVEDAAYVHSPELHSPMAYGVAASAAGEPVRRLHEARGGTLLDAAGLRQRFAEGTLTVAPEGPRTDGPPGG